MLVAVFGCASSDYKRPSTYTVSRGDTLYSIAWRYRTTVSALARANRLRPPYTIYPGQTLRLTKATRRSATAAPRPAPAKPSTPARPPPKWRWPAAATVTKRFGNGNKGIDFHLKVGQRVVAAAAGEVVYAGNGLGGYRYLVIIKHDPQYLSAYSFNVPGRVAEGQRVKAGAILADISSGGRQAQTLHFEIRKNGEAINPLGVIR